MTETTTLPALGSTAESCPTGVGESDAKKLGQYPTPVWVAEALVERYFGDLDSDDCVIEPSCGPGAFLAAIPEHVQAVGVEIDALIAQEAAANTGRRILTGDFRSIQLDVQPTAVIGNPPFNLKMIDGFLERSHALLPEGGRVGFILPACSIPDRRAGRGLCGTLVAHAGDDPPKHLSRTAPPPGVRHVLKGPAPHHVRIRFIPGSGRRARHA